LVCQLCNSRGGGAVWLRGLSYGWPATLAVAVVTWAVLRPWEACQIQMRRLGASLIQVSTMLGRQASARGYSLRPDTLGRWEAYQTRMRRHGVSLIQVSDILGHRPQQPRAGRGIHSSSSKPVGPGSWCASTAMPRCAMF
jgi:hypothetical protein